MRISTISSSIATVVSRVMDSVVIAGAVRVSDHLARMREHLGYWLEPCQPGFAFANCCASNAAAYAAGSPPVDKQPGNKPGQIHQLWQSDIALAYRTAPSRLASVSTTGRV